MAGFNDSLGQAARHPRVAIKPADSLHPFAASATSNSFELNVELHRTPKNGQVSDDPLAVLVNGCTGLVTTAAGRKSGGAGDQVDLQPITIRFDGNDRKALPEGQKRINIVHKNAGL